MIRQKREKPPFPRSLSPSPYLCGVNTHLSMTIEDAFTLIRNTPNPTQQTATWADLGCGSGLFTRPLARLLRSVSSIYGIDRAPGLARQTTPTGVHLLPRTLDFVQEGL